MKLEFSRPVATAITVVAVLVLLLLYACLPDTTPQAEPLPPSKYDAQLRSLDREALDNAYREQLEHLFLVWMRDHTGQPHRAIAGADRARRAYIEVMTEFDKR